MLTGHLRGLSETVNIINVYAPYGDRKSFWQNVQVEGLLNLDNLILVGDFNLVLNDSEVWGVGANLDPLSNYFQHTFASVGLVDIIPSILELTWSNGRLGLNMVSKRLDRFLMGESLSGKFLKYRSWVELNPISDHYPIYLQLDIDR